MTPGEIYLAYFPYGDAPAWKLRPVLLLTPPIGSVPELLVAYITTVMPTVLLPSDLILDPSNPDHASTKIKTISIVRIHKLATMHQSTFMRKIGALSQTLHDEVQARLRALLNL
jgi:mRNA interferase MazF